MGVPTLREKYRALDPAYKPLCSSCSMAKVRGVEPWRNCQRCERTRERLNEVRAWLKARGVIREGE